LGDCFYLKRVGKRIKEILTSMLTEITNGKKKRINTLSS